jgi:RNA polymerase sigma-70 factor (ECF subfamily)
MQSATMTGTVKERTPKHPVQLRQGSGDRLQSRHTGALPRGDWQAPEYHATLANRPMPRAAFLEREQKLAVLLQDIAQGNTQALASLYDTTSALVYSLALRILRNQTTAEDIVMEVFLQVQRLAATYETNRGTPSAWLLTLTRSRAIDRLRMDALRQQREAPLEMAAALPSHSPDPEASSTTAQLRQVVRAALCSLPPEQRQVIEIAYYSGLSHHEIATQLRQPLGTVKTRLRTGMMVLRRRLAAVLETE